MTLLLISSDVSNKSLDHVMCDVAAQSTIQFLAGLIRHDCHRALMEWCKNGLGVEEGGMVNVWCGGTGSRVEGVCAKHAM